MDASPQNTDSTSPSYSPSYCTAARPGRITTKYRLYKSFVVSILLYGCETWTLHHKIQTLQVPRSIHPTVRLRDMDALTTKYRLHKSLVVSILLFDCETWTIRHNIQTL
ncbi:hypothetical protein DPMN_016128 [Dreissena polymorpha]|uniref:Uncharacterized protein n=1 Tax=Dreissena polymorpha TaxID=45954 RepID=A0A9D4NF06_DREPO|nr:hypothetical protein DPMN_016128 [Dreissena polymorpha]